MDDFLEHYLDKEQERFLDEQEEQIFNQSILTRRLGIATPYVDYPEVGPCSD